MKVYKVENEKTFKNSRGITLISLIITVIIMLILAGVSISVLTNSEGLFEKTQLATDIYSQATQNEADQITSLMNNIDIYLSGLPDSIEKYPSGAWTGTVNEPKIDGTGLIPVKFDTIGNPTELTPEQAKNTTWYNYVDTSIVGNENKSEWANAITKNEDGEITGYFVWVPRYEYKITYNNNEDKSQGGIIDVNFISTDTTTPTSGYTIHPVFTNESPNFENGGWKADVPGFWVTKFEAGFAGGGMNDSNNDVSIVDSGLTYTGTYENITNYYSSITSGTTTMNLPVFLPKTYAYNNINIGDMFNLSRKIQDTRTYYGLDNTKVDSHMMKNSEWGAVAYLAHSKYGRNGTEITVNNVNMNDNISTIKSITGYAGSTISASKNNLSIAPTGDTLEDVLESASYVWNTANGALVDGNGSDRSLNYNVLANIARKGEAIWETSTIDNSADTGTVSWNGDYSRFANSYSPFLGSSGSFGTESSSGIFAFSSGFESALSHNSFRTVLFV